GLTLDVLVTGAENVLATVSIADRAMRAVCRLRVALYLAQALMPADRGDEVGAASRFGKPPTRRDGRESRVIAPSFVGGGTGHHCEHAGAPMSQRRNAAVRYTKAKQGQGVRVSRQGESLRASISFHSLKRYRAGFGVRAGIGAYISA